MTERAPIRKAFRPISDDLDAAADDLARRKGIPTLTPPGPAARPRASESETGHKPARPIARDTGMVAPGSGRGGFAAAKAVDAEEGTETDYSYIKCKCPAYLLDQLYLEARRRRVTINHLILIALQAQGFAIRNEDLIPDGRRLRGGRRD